ncbi:MAG: hypothetical protein LBE81_01425 [Azonexus sp.]|jgi:hypothetical protein|uniref:hypothetical protein n=1 Tax=Azonexus sp. TaxID=1872668 RepID=UPI00282C080E|nr:hypothetical protein [Azonexus sp.]MDR0775287.1 hypothetical protein [Azonexus sp.]
MLNIRPLIEKLKISANRRRFEKALHQIASSAPIRTGSDKFTALSMVHHRDVESYLLAIKSFCRFFSPRRIIVVTDPTITDEDRQQMATHVGGIQFVHAENYRIAGMPQGGCWERLIAIAEFVQNDYVIQLDADTVALSEMPEVRKAVEESMSFVLATEDGQDFSSCTEAVAWAKKRAESGEHIQILAESSMDGLTDYQALRYVRGCAGFSGFAVGCFNRDKLKTFSDTMSQILGDKWTAWGTEQFTSNFMVSNSPKAVVLPHPKYCHPGREQPGTVFLHFIGYVRFNTDRYARAARETCAALGKK